MHNIVLYRIEKTAGHGMWYNENGIYQPFIKTLTEGKSRDLPMEHDERYGDYNTRWYSGCPSMDLLKHWFSANDVIELQQAGFRMFQMKATVYRKEEFQVLFTKEGLIQTIELDIDGLLAGWN